MGKTARAGVLPRWTIFGRAAMARQIERKDGEQLDVTYWAARMARHSSMIGNGKGIVTDSLEPCNTTVI
jgi:hypothetical protein